jgi:GR25 family glycosyltransferase involved in LPS biosynthesis
VKLEKASGRLRRIAFRASRAVLGMLSGGRISAFGFGDGKIGMILIVNLDRQPQRLRRTLRELSRFRTAEGISLARLARRLAAVDARDGRAVAATADVDQNYRLGDQLYVQPDARLEECFGVKEPVRMTRQEVAVARSHIEAWKFIVTGPCTHVLVLEDDIWFSRGAAAAINRGWQAATMRTTDGEGPKLLYLSYEDAGGTAARAEVCDALFRPKRGLWFLSGYILSRKGAEILLRSMPVVGPVDMWINYRFEELGALALSTPAILQRPDGGSDNCYSVLPYLARAGIVDSSSVPVPPATGGWSVLAWTKDRDREGLAMALSMLGMRVRAFDGDERPTQQNELPALLETFDALVNARLSACAITAAIARTDVKFILEVDASLGGAIQPEMLPLPRTAFLTNEGAADASWQPICTLLGLDPPIQPFPVGPPREWRMFRDDRSATARSEGGNSRSADPMDDTPWTLPPISGWPLPSGPTRADRLKTNRILHAALTAPTPLFPGLVETFPGNLATFAREGTVYGAEGVRLILSKIAPGDRPYRSGAFASARAFGHGRFEAEIKAAHGSGVVTGFFLHRNSPRQEIDIELIGNDPYRMLVNVYFNPGDEGAVVGFGYRGSPCRIELGFDATSDFHHYAIDWRPGCISWSVDGEIVHERVSWEPTPIPHLPMRLHANLWAPRSEELAGRVEENALPLSSGFKNVSIWT